MRKTRKGKLLLGALAAKEVVSLMLAVLILPTLLFIGGEDQQDLYVYFNESEALQHAPAHIFASLDEERPDKVYYRIVVDNETGEKCIMYWYYYTYQESNVAEHLMDLEPIYLYFRNGNLVYAKYDAWHWTAATAYNYSLTFLVDNGTHPVFLVDPVYHHYSPASDVTNATYSFRYVALNDTAIEFFKSQKLYTGPYTIDVGMLLDTETIENPFKDFDDFWEVNSFYGLVLYLPIKLKILWLKYFGG